jgi:hypothetical protein
VGCGKLKPRSEIDLFAGRLTFCIPAGKVRRACSPAQTGAARLYPSKRSFLQVPLEDAMFKRRKDAGSRAGRSAKIGSLVAGLGGVLGGLLFWRKRKAS